MSDDYSANTTTTGVLSLGAAGSASASGQIETRADRDWFAVTLAAEQTYTFGLAATAPGGLGDPFLALYSANGVLLGADDDGGDWLDSLFSYTTTAAGTYYLQARDYSSGIGAYRITASLASAIDRTAPTVASFSPANGSSRTQVSDNIVVTFDEPVQMGTGVIALKTANGVLVESYDAATSTRLRVDGAVLTVDPSNPLMSGNAYRMEFAPGTLSDIAGNAYAGTTSYTFSTAGALSQDDYAGNSTSTGSLSVGSSVSGRIESANDTDWFAVSLSAGQTYTFGLDGAATGGLDDPLLTLFGNTGTLLAYDDDSGSVLNALLSFSPAVSATYYLQASHYGNGIGAYTLSARATIRADTTAPTVVSFSPADEASAVDPSSNILLTFSEAIARGTGAIALRTSAGTLVESFDAATSARLSVSGTSLILAPTAALASGTGYRVDFAPGNIRDLAGNEYAGTSTYNFSTRGDTTAPTVIRFSPADEATSVAVGSNIVVTFSESIQRGLGTVVLKTAAGALVESFDVASSARLSVSGATLTLDPTSNLANATGYRIEFAAGNIKDLAGNAYAGTSAYNFTTVAAASVDDYAASTGTTGRIAIGASASGRIETINDRDWFAVNLTAGQTYTFRLNAAITNGLDDPYLSLYGATGALLAANDDGDTGYNALLSYTAGSSGTVYLEARHYGSGMGAYTLLASADATSTPGTSGFTIAINYSGAPAYQRYFDEAAARWAQIITGDLPDVSANRGVIDDLLIDASVGAIDGVGNVLGQAGYTAIRGGGLPYLGVMEFDEADIARLVANGTFGSVVLHEMGHVLGLSGYLWQQRGLVSSASPYLYTGANAVAAYDALSAATPAAVPLESGGGSGTAGSHWSEAVFDRELMTGYAESTPPMPISIITIGALADLGYRVNYTVADAFSL